MDVNSTRSLKYRCEQGKNKIYKYPMNINEKTDRTNKVNLPVLKKI